MVWLAVDKDGSEWVYESIPERNSGRWYIIGDKLFNGRCICLPNGSIEKLIGRKMTWIDESVRY